MRGERDEIMKEKELREHAECSLCKNKIGESGIPMFWTVKIERHGINLQATRRQHGLGMHMGAELAMIMGPDEELTMPMMKPIVLTVCEECACMSDAHCLASMAEMG